MPPCIWPDFIEIIGIISWRGLGSIVFERRAFGFLVMLHLWMSIFVMYVLREYDLAKFNKSMKATSSTNWTICHIFVDHKFCSKSIWKLEIFVNSTSVWEVHRVVERWIFKCREKFWDDKQRSDLVDFFKLFGVLTRYNSTSPIFSWIFSTSLFRGGTAPQLINHNLKI